MDSTAQVRTINNVSRITLLLMTLCLTNVVHAATGYTPGMYVDFDATSKHYHDVTFRTIINYDSGPDANVFYANQFGSSDGSGGYVGTQTIRDSNDRHLWLFSVWNATDCETNNAMPGAVCHGNTDGAPGYSVRVNYKWIVGHVYAQRIQQVPGQSGWWEAWVTDETTGESFLIGALQFANGGYLTPVTFFVENWDWNNPKATCLTSPYSSSTVYPVDGDAGKSRLINPRAGSVPGPCNTGSFGVSNSDGSASLTQNPNATGRVAVSSGQDSMCVTLLSNNASPNDLAIAETCNSMTDHQNVVWTATKQLVIGLLCMAPAANNRDVAVYSCDEADRNQQWLNVPGTLYLKNVATETCLTKTRISGQWLSMDTCGSDPGNQQWHIRDRQ